METIDKTPLQLAREALDRRIAAGEKIERLNPMQKAKADPKSKAKALRAYFWDQFMVEQNKGLEGVSARELADDARTAYKDARKGGLALALKRTCLGCVGDGEDTRPKLEIRDCLVTDCPLHPVRPFQHLKGRAGSQI